MILGNTSVFKGIENHPTSLLQNSELKNANP